MQTKNYEIKLNFYERLVGRLFLKSYNLLTSLRVDQEISNKYHDTISRFYDATIALFMPKYLRVINYVIENYIRAGLTVLDLCTGTGNIAIAASKKAGSVTAIDASRKMLERAKRKTKKIGTNILFQQGDVTKRLDFNDESFEHVCAGFSVPANIPLFREHNEKIMQEAFRVLKNEGSIILIAGNKIAKIYLSEQEYHDLLTKVGFNNIEVIDIDRVYVVIIAEKHNKEKSKGGR